MSNYSLIERNNEYIVYENLTGNHVFKTDDQEQAYDKLTHFNMGGGFDGWTPSFFLTEIPEFEELEE